MHEYQYCLNNSNNVFMNDFLKNCRLLIIQYVHVCIALLFFIQPQVVIERARIYLQKHVREGKMCTRLHNSLLDYMTNKRLFFRNEERKNDEGIGTRRFASRGVHSCRVQHLSQSPFARTEEWLERKYVAITAKGFSKCMIWGVRLLAC